MQSQPAVESAPNRRSVAKATTGEAGSVPFGLPRFGLSDEQDGDRTQLLLQRQRNIVTDSFHTFRERRRRRRGGSGTVVKESPFYSIKLGRA